MRLVLKGIERLEMEDGSIPEKKEGFEHLRVLYCAVCRTDAKMWKEGHRDLAFPRVLGHELVARGQDGKIYTVWPGKSCGTCFHCIEGRENLCDDIKIMGFHYDGGFSQHLLAPVESLIRVPDDMPHHLACFAEPVGCAIHAMEKLGLEEGKRLVIYGGGTLGLITALLARLQGVIPTVIEKNEEKIHKAAPFLQETGIRCCKDTTDSRFEAGLNACPDLIAFAQCMIKLAKGGRLAFFSGLPKNEKLETNLVNLAHYRELEIYGSYGLTRADMARALKIIRENKSPFERLVEKIVPAAHAPELPLRVLSGKAFKYILDLSDWRVSPQSKPPGDSSSHKAKNLSLDSFHPEYRSLIKDLRPIHEELRPAAQAKIDNKTKPLGALGRLEELAVQLCLVQNDLNPRVERKSLFVFASDHGVVEEGVSAYPAEVTHQMVLNFLNGGAAINVLCRHYGIDIRVVDMGVNADFDDHPLLVKKKVRRGTRNFAIEPAMTPDEAVDALQKGMNLFLAEHGSNRIDIVGMGDMGIGNTTAATAIISAVTGITPREIAGRGTGIDDRGLEHKARVMEKALGYHKPDSTDGLDILHKVGGFEIAGIAGATLAAASRGVTVVLDGVISTAGGLIAYLINPDVKGYLVSGHRSVEPSQKAALSYMGIDPLVDLNMRLGEGTGAAVAINLAEAASRIMAEMASFDDAGVSKKL